MTEAEEFWNYAVSVYDRSRETCLALQDDFGFEVNLLLFCCWRGSQGVALSGPILNHVVDASAKWRVQVVEPLRATRRWLKGRPAPEGSEELRRAILGLELEGERLLQVLILSAAGPTTRRTAIDTAGARRIAGENLRLYQEIVETSDLKSAKGHASDLIQGLLSGVFAEDAVTGIVSARDGAVGAPD